MGNDIWFDVARSVAVWFVSNESLFLGWIELINLYCGLNWIEWIC